jgi:hypothetical protein
MPIGKPKRKRRSKIKRTDKKQSARFIAAAKELGLEGTGDAFERAMNTLATKKLKRSSS